jgi:hypothetical protein
MIPHSGWARGWPQRSTKTPFPPSSANAASALRSRISAPVALLKRHNSVCSAPIGQAANVFVHNCRASGVNPAGGFGFFFT